MKLTINTSIKDVDSEGQGKAVLEVYFEHPNPEARDALVQTIMDFFNKEEETEKEQKEPALGFQMDLPEEEELDEWEGDEEGKCRKCCKHKRK